VLANGAPHVRFHDLEYEEVVWSMSVTTALTKHLVGIGNCSGTEID